MRKVLSTIGCYFLFFLLTSALFAQQNQLPQALDTQRILQGTQRNPLADGDNAVIYLPAPPSNTQLRTEQNEQPSEFMPPVVYTPPSVRLEKILSNESEREAAVIQLELPSNAPAGLAVQLAEIERLWNQGRSQEAIAQLQQMESSHGPLDLAIGISWKTPKAIQTPAWGTDVKIGNRASIYKTCLDSDSGTGHLFAALKYYESGYYCWSVNISKDGGSTWFETFTYSSGSNISDISAVVLSGYFYVGYTITYDARIRRFSVNDGLSDGSYSYLTVFNKGSEVRYLGLTSNADDVDNTILYIGLLANYSIIYYYGNITGTTWTEVPTGITNAYRGLDVAYNVGYDQYYLSISYIDVNYNLRVAQTDDYSNWRYISIQQVSSSDRYTAIAAYDDRVITAYEYRPSSSSPTRIRYHISYDGGSNWYYGEFTSSANNSLYDPDLAARKGGGISLTFSEDASSFDYCWYSHRDYGTGPGTAPWSALETFNANSVYTYYPMTLNWIPPKSGYSTAYGAIYISSNAFFDRLDAVVGPSTISVTYPNGGEVWKVGTPYEITWTSDKYVGRVKVEISTTGGTSWWDVTQGTFTNNDGGYIYTPVSQNISASCLFRVTSIESPSATDDSDNKFTILDASSLKHYVAAHVPYGTAVPVIDGDLSDLAWSCVTGTEVLQRGGVPEDYLTPWSNFSDNKVTWKALWSSSTNLLYVAIEIQDDIAGAVDNDYNSLWQDDCIELFTDGDHNGGNYSGSYFNAQQWLIRRDNAKHLESLSGYYTGPAINSAVRQGSNGNWVLELSMVIYDHYSSDIRPLVMYDVIGWEVWYDDSDNSHQESGKWARDHQVGWGYVGPAWYNADAFQELELGPAGTPPQQPDIAIDPTSWNFGAVSIGGYSEKTFVVKNEGNASLNVTSTTITGANASEFSIISGGGSFTLSPSATRNLVVRFTPTTTGSKTASLSISSNDPDPSENPLLVSLSGSATVPDISVDPSSWNYGSVTVGGYQEKTFVVKNDGNANLNVTATTITGANASEFSIQSGGGSFSLAPLATRNLVVRFTPASAGSKTATLSISSNDPDENPFNVSLSGTGTVPDISVTPASWDYGAINVGSVADKIFQVKNDGSANLLVTATTLTGTNAAEFSIQSGGGSFTLSPGASQNITV
ncbi:MAG: choice-of-anchor D domain-containing protein, partial [candidate division KSB1 bacterium]|nr:choice-of-anchor D domain-containing protein [candidate division KSB1 bacterium]